MTFAEFLRTPFLTEHLWLLVKCGVTDIGLSDHRLIYCTSEISRIKRGSYKQKKFRSFKHYIVDLFEQEFSKLNFPNYQNCKDIVRYII